MTKRASFLPLFFISLAVVFGAAVFFRIRAHSRDVAEAAPTGPLTSTIHGGERPTLTPAQRGVFSVDPATSPTQSGSSAASATGTIVDVPTDTVSGAEPATNRRPTTREERFAELLRKPVPSSPRPAPTPPAEKPSLLSRVASTIASAFGGGSSPSPSSSSPRQMQSSQPLQQQVNELQQQVPQQQAVEPPTETTPPLEDGQPPDDPDSDSMPPQLMAMEFIPPTVQDGSETMVVVTATDNLSGIRQISGSIASPTSAMQGFALMREGETNRYVARIAVPKDAAEGVWKVSLLSMTDNASNSITLTEHQRMIPPGGRYTVVSSRPDSSAPTLRAIRIEKNRIRAGERSLIYIQADDDKTGIDTISGVFQSPQKHARIGFGCVQAGEPTAWECEMRAPACLDCGDWQLEQIQLQDKAKNMVAVRNENALVKNITLNMTSDLCDAVPPVVAAAGTETNSVSNAERTMVKFTVMADDEGCGVQSVSGHMGGPPSVGDKRIFIRFDATADPRVFTGTAEIPQFAAKGIWKLVWLQALDKANNLRAYGQGDPVLANAVIEVH